MRSLPSVQQTLVAVMIIQVFTTTVGYLEISTIAEMRRSLPSVCSKKKATNGKEMKPLKKSNQQGDGRTIKILLWILIPCVLWWS